MTLTPDSQIPADYVAPFHKEAFLGALMSAARGALPFMQNAARIGASAAGRAVNSVIPAPAMSGLKTLGGKMMPGAVGQAFEPYGKQIERGAVNLAGKAFGQQAKPLAHRLVRGVPREIAREATGGALIGGALNGGISAYTAEDGQGLSAFAKGFGSGAMTGAAHGALSGAIGKTIGNARSEVARRTALQQGVAPKNLNSTLKAQANRGVFGSGKDLLTGQGPLGRAGAGLHLAGGAAQFAGDWYLPSMIMGDGEQPPAPPQPQPYQAPGQLQQPQQPQPKVGSYGLRPIDFTKLPGYHNKQI